MTSAFPFYPGEQFLEDEISHWGNSEFKEVYIIPNRIHGAPRAVPKNIEVSQIMGVAGRISKCYYLLRTIFSKIVWKEIVALLKARKIRPYTLMRIIIDGSRILSIESHLEKFAIKHGKIDLVYCYWNTLSAYAACLVKERNRIGKVITRIHGGDLYEDRCKFEYMPYKRQFVNNFDKIFCLATQGKSYVLKKYNFVDEQIEISRLGVPVPSIMTRPTKSNCLNILSVSFCVEVKRIDKIIEAVAKTGYLCPSTSIKWTHIGGGAQFKSLLKKAEVELTSLQNVEFEFLGSLPREKIFEFYSHNEIDVFINSSESEGVPVSIMEAMSFGVPAIAPDIGGISDLIEYDCGCLLKANPTAIDISNALIEWKLRSKDLTLRSKVKEMIGQNYNAEVNYTRFIARLHEIAIK